MGRHRKTNCHDVDWNFCGCSGVAGIRRHVCWWVEFVGTQRNWNFELLSFEIHCCWLFCPRQTISLTLLLFFWDLLGKIQDLKYPGMFSFALRGRITFTKKILRLYQAFKCECYEIIYFQAAQKQIICQILWCWFKMQCVVIFSTRFDWPRSPVTHQFSASREVLQNINCWTAFCSWIQTEIRAQREFKLACQSELQTVL